MYGWHHSMKAPIPGWVRPFLCGLVFSLHLHGFPLGAPALSHSSKLGYLVTLDFL